MSGWIEESLPMRTARRLGLDGLAWSLRRFHCPVPEEALVLEVGSGGNPYARANVLLDAYEDTQERHWARLVSDRPTVLGFVENLPFRDHAFDFVIASHVLEHSAHPDRFLMELQRVARAGYIEVPDAFMERINPYHDHRLEITVRDGRLVIRKKPAWRADAELVELYEQRAKRRVSRELIPVRPFDFHVRYYWSQRIDFEVRNPEVDASWNAPMSAREPRASDPRSGLRRITRLLFSQNRRNRQIDLIPLLRCPSCKGTEFDRLETGLSCRGCGSRFPLVGGIPRLIGAAPA
jgi:SAM-dependent methyltransferase